ncbi:Arylsulfatase A [Paracoccus alcaliphilus]|uniref:Arylsulfatase A n=1 Tax=Paracoccus alcaliphilus TaxID=34002 RepID=A0A1H8K1Y8_9RHOB|nr:sulfatase-like hydrolase/transferase [Paracoccus alcaliphilus]WCR17503.1 sulfatase-like hydrolase/transferase [Paracoccus alcaliphilus]SEN87004.1 Arylsulfatase A [Paracoccus alcaliphilus]
MVNHLMIAFDDLFNYKDFIQASGKWGRSPFGIEVSLPNLARLEARSTSFRRAACTIAACGPSRASIMSGYSPYETGVLNDENWRDHIKVEQIWSYHLRQAGYWMGTVGKVFHGYVPQPSSVYQALYDSEPFTVIHNPSTERTDWGGLYGIGFDNEEHWYDVMVSETTADFLANIAPGIAAEGRFWHWEAGFHHPHNPWYTPNRIYESIDLDDIVMPEDWPLSWDLLPFAVAFTGMGQHLGSPSPSTWDEERIDWWRKSVRNYIAAVIFADEKLGVILDALEASPFNDNTLITCWSDHGYHLGDKGVWHKFSLWEEACNAPLLISAPGQTTGRTVWQPVSLVDIGPTVCDYLGVDLPDHFRGISLRPLVEGGTMPERMIPSFHYGSASGGIDDWRVSVYQDETFEFYNVMTDPWMKDNIAAREPDNPLFLQYRDMLYEACRDWGLDIVADGAIIRPGTPFASLLGWEPSPHSPTNSLFVMGDLDERARSPNYRRMYQMGTIWRDPADRLIKMPLGVGSIYLRNTTTGATVVGNDGGNFITLAGGRATRTVIMGDGDDTLSGSPNGGAAVTGGRVIAYGGRGNDLIYGGSGTGGFGPGNSELYGGAGDDTLMGGAGNDLLIGGAGDDSIRGGAGDDTIIADAGNDRINADSGEDLIILQNGSHFVWTGAAGTDTVRVMRTGQVQTIGGLTASDVIDLSDWAGIQPVNVALAGGQVEITAAFEKVICETTNIALVAGCITGATVAA